MTPPAAFDVVAGPPPTMRLGADHPLYARLRMLLGLADGVLDLPLPEPDDEGWVALPAPSPAPGLDLAGASLVTTGVSVRVVGPPALVVGVEATLPAPLTALSLAGSVSVAGSGLALDLAPTVAAVGLSPGVVLAVPAACRLSATLGPDDAALVLAAPQQPAVVTLPGGQVLVRSVLLTPSSLVLRGGALVRGPGNLDVDLADVDLTIDGSGVSLQARAPVRGSAAVGPFAAGVDAVHAVLRVDGDGVDTVSVTGATVTGSLDPVGRLAASGSLAYAREAPPTGETPAGPRWEVVVDDVAVPGPLDRLLPQGEVRARLWPDHDAVEVRTTLTGDLPFLGRVDPVVARYLQVGSRIDLELTGLVSPALSFGPGLPSLRLGPCHLQATLDHVLTGVVEDEFGQPVGGRAVEVRDRSGTVLAAVTTDDAGTFEVVPVPPGAARLHVDGLRVTSVGPAEGGAGTGGRHGLLAFAATGAVPIDVPAGFPVLSSARVETSLAWTRGEGLALAFPAGLPPIDLGPLRLVLTSLSASRTALADGDTLTELALDGTLELDLPLLDDPLAITATGLRAQWREQGTRRLAVDGATLTLPADLPVLGGAVLTGDAELVTLPPGAAGGSTPATPGTAGASPDLGLTVRLAPTSVPPLELVAGIRVVVSDDLSLRLRLPPEETIPRLDLPSGNVALETPLATLTVHDVALAPDHWSVSGDAVLDLGLDVLSVGGGSAALRVDADGWSATLTLTDLALDVGDVHLAADAVNGSLTHREDSDELRLDVTGVDLGPLGLTADGQVVVVSRTSEDGSSGGVEREVFVELALDWADLHDLPALLPHWPVPFPASGSLTATLTWAQTADGHDVALRLRGATDDVGALFAVVPEPLRPEVEEFAFTLSLSLADADLAGAEIAADVALRLPDLAALGGSDLVQLRTGDETGLLRATLRAGYEAGEAADGDGTSSDGTAYLRFDIADALTLALSLPGMPQEEPPIEASVSSVGFDLAAGGAADALTGALRASGTFALRPPDPPPFVPLGHHVRGLLEQTGLDEVTGTIDLTLAFTDSAAAAEAVGRFDGAALDVNLFDVLSGLTRGLGPPPADGGPEIPISLEAGFELLELRLRFGPPLADLAAGAATDAPSFAVGFGVAFHLGEAAASMNLDLSDRELALTLGELRLPLQVPVFPLVPEDLDGLDDGAAWDARRAALVAALDAIPEPPPGVTSPERVLATGRLGAFDGIRLFWDKAANNRSGYLDLARAAVGVLRQATTTLHVDTDIALELRDVGFFFPFADPSAIRVQGDAALVGFAPDDPLAFLGALQLGLGLSADRIFFQLRTTSVVDLPDLGGRYPGGSLDLSQFSIGYGYTRNSLAVNVAGKLVLPERLVEDADTSATWGAGVRLPTHNRLGFRLDVIPVSLGPVEFVVPLLELEVDLRTPGAPPFTDLATCTPYWDGLQVHVPGVLRADLKHLAFSPFFTMIPAPNLRLDADLAIGDDTTGLRVIANDVHVFAGVLVNAGYAAPISFLASPSEPYVENLCVRLHVAGFGIRFNLERPFPSLNPLALFEVLGLLADPLMPVDPGGHLANTVRVSLTNARLTLPEQVSRLFPDAPGVDKDLDVTVNLGTLITLVQVTWGALEPALDVLLTGPGDLAERLGALTRRPPALAVGDVLGALPPDLRKLRLHGDLGGFEAGAVVVLLAPGEAAAELARRGLPAPAPPTETTFSFDAPADAADVVALRPQVVSTPYAKRHADPGDPQANLFAGIEFAAFDTTDLAHLPAPRREGQAGVMIGAHVTLAPGQRFRFLGALWEDGSFGLTSALDVGDLRLSVAGIPVPLPLAINGRLSLQGRVRQYGARARVTGELSLTDWRPLGLSGPLRDLVRLDAEGTLALDGTGEFYVAGSGTLRAFWGAVEMSGRVEVSHAHCAVEGYAALAIGTWGSGPAVAVQLGDPKDPGSHVRARIGPGNGLALGGTATVWVLGQEVLGARVDVTERGASLEARLTSFSLVGWDFPEVDLALRGEAAWSGPDGGRFSLEGTADVAFGGRDAQGRPRPGTVLLRGAARARGDSAGASLALEGALWWQGCRWASGRVELGTAGIRLSGGTSFEVELTPSSTPFGTELAALVLRVSLDGAFELGLPTPGDGGLGDLTWDLGSARLQGECLLGLRLPSAGGGSAAHDQVLGLARQRFDGRLDLGAIDLVRLDELQLLPFQDELEIQVPKVEVDAEDPLTLSIQHRTTNDPSLAFTLGNVVRFSDGSTTWYFPWQPAARTSNTRQSDVGVSVPRVTMPAGEFHTLALSPGLVAPIRLSLVWADGALTIRYRFGTLPPESFPLADLVARLGHAADLLDG